MAQHGGITNPMGDSRQTNTDTARSDQSQSHAELASWVAHRVQIGRRARDQKYSKRWEEYTRLWRGFWTENDKSTDSERSKLIAPALQQAIEMTVAEMEESTFSRTAWFDITDDIRDENKDDAIRYRDQLREDMDLDGVPHAVSQVYLLGAVYGTGIAKINVEEKENPVFDQQGRRERPRISVPATPIRPDQLVIDPPATSIEEAGYVAHEMVKPLNLVKQRQRAGVYRKTKVEPWSGQRANTDGTGGSRVGGEDEAVLLTEYYGRVPGVLLDDADGREGMVEAIITMANDNTILRAQANPYTMGDRPIVAYQHETVPGEFWGRGVSEKGFNPQKALDAELRARIDALALISAPMMGADITRMPRNPDLKVKPGKTVFTRGRPSEIMEPMAFGDPAILSHTFQHTGDLERMVQMGTGAMDSATPVGVNSRNETASGISQLQSGFIKRSKRTMHNVERQFLSPLVRKILWRRMQFDSENYPIDFKFVVKSTMGIMAKEIENAQLTNMLGFLEPGTQAHNILIQAIFENTASANKEELAEAIRAMNRPPSEEQQQLQQKIQQLEIQEKEAEIAKTEAEAAEARAQALYHQAQALKERVEAELEDDRVEIEAANAAVNAQNARAKTAQVEAAFDKNEAEREKARQQNQQESGSDNNGTTDD